MDYKDPRAEVFAQTPCRLVGRHLLVVETFVPIQRTSLQSLNFWSLPRFSSHTHEHERAQNLDLHHIGSRTFLGFVAHLHAASRWNDFGYAERNVD